LGLPRLNIDGYVYVGLEECVDSALRPTEYTLIYLIARKRAHLRWFQIA